MLENQIELANYGFRKTDDNQWVALCLTGTNQPEKSYVMPSVALRHFIGQLIEFEAGVQVDTAFAAAGAPQSSAESLSATESALLHAKTVDLVRWESGGSVFRATTPEGISLQLVLTPAHREFLLHALSSELPK